MNEYSNGTDSSPGGNVTADGATTEMVVQAWARAEARGDAGALAELLAEDFRGIGPHGFVLDRAAWLARFQMPHHIDRLAVESVESRVDGDTAVVIGVQDQVASYRDHPASGRFRLCLILTRASTAVPWTVLGSQLSGPIPDLPAA